MSALAEFLIARIVEDEAVEVDIEVESSPMNMAGVIRPRTREVHYSPSPRQLAECKAKRGIIALDDRGYDMEPAMMHLATVYADHPDYREEWKP